MDKKLKFTLRISERVDVKLKELAKKENRSKNQMIEYILKKYIDDNA